MDTTTSLVPSLPDAIVPAHEARSAFLSHLAEWSITQKIRKRGFIYQDVSLEVSGPQFVRVELDSVSDGRQERMPSSVVRLAYVFEFENKGEVIGVTMPHPHGQIYAFPFIPPKIQTELNAAKEHRARTGRCLFCDVVEEERRDGRRILLENEGFVATVPFFARYPYEVNLFSRRHLLDFTQFEEEEIWDLARILKCVLLKYDNLYGFSFPYMMIIHQQPTDGDDHSSYHFHIEFLPPYRSRTKLKYLAGCESGAGTFINDSSPEEKAQELRETEPRGIEA